MSQPTAVLSRGQSAPRSHIVKFNEQCAAKKQAREAAARAVIDEPQRDREERRRCEPPSPPWAKAAVWEYSSHEGWWSLSKDPLDEFSDGVSFDVALQTAGYFQPEVEREPVAVAIHVAADDTPLTRRFPYYVEITFANGGNANVFVVDLPSLVALSAAVKPLAELINQGQVGVGNERAVNLVA